MHIANRVCSRAASPPSRRPSAFSTTAAPSDRSRAAVPAYALLICTRTFFSIPRLGEVFPSYHSECPLEFSSRICIAVRFLELRLSSYCSPKTFSAPPQPPVASPLPHPLYHLGCVLVSRAGASRRRAGALSGPGRRPPGGRPAP